MEEFVACFAEVVDPRQDNARHNLHELLLIALCTILTGGKDCSDMALFGTVGQSPYQSFFRSNVRFDQEAAALIFSARLLSTRLTGSNTVVRHALKHDLQSAETNGHPDLIEDLRQM